MRSIWRSGRKAFRRAASFPGESSVLGSEDFGDLERGRRARSLALLKKLVESKVPFRQVSEERQRVSKAPERWLGREGGQKASGPSNRALSRQGRRRLCRLGYPGLGRCRPTADRWPLSSRKTEVGSVFLETLLIREEKLLASQPATPFPGLLLRSAEPTGAGGFFLRHQLERSSRAWWGWGWGWACLAGRSLIP